jgi:hypothetical protein
LQIFELCSNLVKHHCINHADSNFQSDFTSFETHVILGAGLIVESSI